MVRRLRAVYENGLFRPLETVQGLADQTPVRLRVEECKDDASELSEFAGIWSAEEADEVSALIDQEFGRVDRREW